MRNVLLGLYQALIFRHSMGTAYSEQALASAVNLKDHAGKSEQLYIEAAVAGSDAAKTAGEEVSSTLRGGYDDAGEPKKGTKESMAILQEVLKVAPNDSAANHYWIHAVEASAHRASPQQRNRAGQSCAGFWTYGSYAGSHLLSRG